MAYNQDERNRYQINRLDNRGCFVEVKSDWFSRDQIHFEFATYDTRRPEGERFTNHVHIYLDGPKFLALAADVLSGTMLTELRYPTKAPEEVLFEHLGGTSAEKLARYGNPRKDGMGQSRIMRIVRGKKKDSVMLVADNGKGEANKTGLVVPRFGSAPENHVVISADYEQLKQLIAPAQIQYAGYCQAIVFKRTMDGEFQNALSFQNNNVTSYPTAMNFNR